MLMLMLMKVGETVKVGAQLARVAGGAAGGKAAAAVAPVVAAAPAAAPVAAAAAATHGRTPLIQFRHGMREAVHAHAPAPAAARAPPSPAPAAPASAGRPGPRAEDFRNYNDYLAARYGAGRGAAPETEAPWAHRKRLSDEEMAAINSGGAL